MELNWNDAKDWQEKANEEKEEFEPKWDFDCSFKLDFDGSLLTVSSRFYPPHKNTGDHWSGKMRIYFLNERLIEKEFKSDTLDQLKIEVEGFLKKYTEVIRKQIDFHDF